MKCIAAYLSHRSQYICHSVSNSFSDILPAVSGVLQKCPLVSLFVYKWPSFVSIIIAFIYMLYGDDTKCLRHERDLSEMNCLQKDVDNLFQWSLTSAIYSLIITSLYTCSSGQRTILPLPIQLTTRL